jgi:hypothetical protein
MKNNQNHSPKKRQYPPFWERFVPIAVSIILGIVVILILIILAVAIGLIPNSGIMI